MDQPMPPEHQTDRVDDPPVAVLPGAVDWSPRPLAFAPEPVVRVRDAVAAAVGNASLLSIGYLLLGRRLVAFQTMLVTATIIAPSMWFGHRVVDAPMTMRTDRTVDACRRLQQASDRLAVSLARGDTDALGDGFRGLDAVLAELPGHDRMVDVALDRFLGGLPTKDACRTSSLTDWLKDRKPTGNGLDRAATVVPRVAPPALLGCAGDRMAATDFRQAQQRYQQLLDEYPGHELTAKAQEGVTKARLAAELAHVRSLQGTYCTKPAAYSGAPEFRGGAAVLVLCTGQTEFGTPTETCPYRSDRTGVVGSVIFRKLAIPVKAYELRTGKVVLDTKVEIGGTSCPGTFYFFGATPPPNRYVSPSDGDVRAGYAAVITP